MNHCKTVLWDITCRLHIQQFKVIWSPERDVSGCSGVKVFVRMSSCLSARLSSFPVVARMQRAAGRSGAVHRHRGRPIHSSSPLLPGPPSDGEDGHHHVSGENYGFHQSAGDPSASRERHVCQVTITNPISHAPSLRCSSYCFSTEKSFECPSRSLKKDDQIKYWLLNSLLLHVYFWFFPNNV